MNTKIKVGMLAAGLFAVSSLCADTVAYWNFNGLSIATASAPGAGGVPTSISADSGAGTLSLGGWSGLVDDFAGTTTNAQNSAAAEESLSLVSNAGNGTFISVSLNLSGYSNVSLTFATQGTATGFSSGIWSYSVSGGSFTDIAGNTAKTTSGFELKTVDLTSIVGIDNQSSVVLRYTLSGASSASGNNRIDNLLVTGTLSAVPEPSAYATIAGALALAGVVIYRRGRTMVKAA